MNKSPFLNIKTTAESMDILYKCFAAEGRRLKAEGTEAQRHKGTEGEEGKRQKTERREVDSLPSAFSLQPSASYETIPFLDANNRVLAQDVYSQEDVPNFNRSTMDGYGLDARDTFGASSGMPAYLNIAGDVLMGEAASLSIKSGEAVRMPTGGSLPDGANAVVMIEHSCEIDNKTVEIQKPVAIGENTVCVGQDIKKGGLLFSAGRLLRAYEIGALAAIGQTEVIVYQRLRVGIISTGDEIVPAHILPKSGQVRDISSTLLGSKILELGAIPEFYGIVKDRVELIRDAITVCVAKNDMVLICGGSSVGTRDLVVDVISSMGEILIHGVAMRPGKPTIIAQIGGKPVIGLPGHPASSTIVFLVLVQPLLAHLQNTPLIQWHITATTTRNIPSQPGREDYIRVKIQEKDGRYLAEPVFGPSGLITPVFEANGLIKIPIDCEGIDEGQEMRVMLM
ncbi:molybdopterin molybdotransferase MoeA [Candidatus Desantisbacteria bacterium]|nr:molybdopterin molybdotransferase MoeA [Candidatus Desantisbacteria bacterium]